MDHSYTAGKSEIAMGKAIKKYGWKRSDLVISTKVRRLNKSLRWTINQNTNICGRSTGEL